MTTQVDLYQVDLFLHIILTVEGDLKKIILSDFVYRITLFKHEL